MPGNQVKDWHIYHECMKGKRASPANKTYCAKVANAVAGGSVKHSNAELIIRFGVEQGIRDGLADHNTGPDTTTSA